MSRISRVLCVIDPTTEQQHALDRAAWLAGRLGAELELFICYYNEYLSGDRFFDSPSLARAREEVIAGHRRHLDALASPLQAQGLKVTTDAVWDHPLYEGIVRQAHRCGADLVVKDTHHHAAAVRAFLSHTDWQLIRNCAAPLWLVKPRELGATPTVVAALDPMNSNDKPAALRRRDRHDRETGGNRRQWRAACVSFLRPAHGRRDGHDQCVPAGLAAAG
ncbi:MAG: universal stress protein [Woeseiaceae bacterium]|nr:universal stress protein [Woeseiaceae bacterium]